MYIYLSIWERYKCILISVPGIILHIKHLQNRHEETAWRPDRPRRLYICPQKR